MDVRPGRAPRGTHQGHRLAALHRLAHSDERALVVCVAGHVAITVIDLNQVAVADPLSGPGHDTRRDGHDVRARRACEVHTLVVGLVAAERVFPLAEIRGNEAAGHRATLRMNLLFELLRENHVLERGELRVTQVHTLLECRQHRGEIGDLGAHALTVRLGTTTGRIPAEIELTIIDIGHLGEALAQRIEPDDMRIHFAEAHGHGVDALLQLALQLRDLAFLLGQNVSPVGGLTESQRTGVAAT